MLDKSAAYKVFIPLAGRCSASWSIYKLSPAPPGSAFADPPPSPSNVDQDSSGVSHMPVLSFCWQACSSDEDADSTPKGTSTL